MTVSRLDSCSRKAREKNRYSVSKPIDLMTPTRNVIFPFSPTAQPNWLTIKNEQEEKDEREKEKNQENEKCFGKFAAEIE